MSAEIHNTCPPTIRGGWRHDSTRIEAVLDAWAARLSAQVIAAKMGITKGSVMSIVYRARRCGDPRAAARTATQRTDGRPIGRTDALLERILPLRAGGASTAEIAEACGISQGYVSSALHRARLAGRPEAAYRPRGRRTKVVVEA